MQQGKYRFSEEPFLLKDFIKNKDYKTIVDLGAGCGIISILLSARFPKSKIFAIECEEESFQKLETNIQEKEIDNITAVQCWIEDAHKFIAPNTIDLVVCNPPYFDEKKNRISPYAQKRLARSCKIEQLEGIIKEACILLKERSLFYMCISPQRLVDVFILLRKYHFGVKRLKAIYGSQKKNAFTVLIESTYNTQDNTTMEIPLYTS
ncbi:MAG: methyltransferase [Deltaproteobacteria bacterium]|nr:methyltransferase [Deltaproteobacteria bacterium]